MVAPTIRKLIVHEIHRPALVDACRYGRGLRLLPNDSVSRLDPQLQFKFAINAIHPIVVPSVDLHVVQVQKAQPESPVALIVGQTEQVVGDFDILCGLLCLVAVTGLAYAKGQAS